MGGRQVTVAGHIQHGDDFALGIENRRRGAGHEAVGLQEVFIVFNMHGLGAGQCGADGIGATGAFHPTGAGAEATGQRGFDKPLGTPRGQHLALVVGQHDQAIGIAEDVLVVGQHFLVGGLHQGMLAFQELAYAFGGQLVKAGGALVVQAVGAATAPGFLDKGVVGQGFGHRATFFIIVVGSCAI